MIKIRLDVFFFLTSTLFRTIQTDFFTVHDRYLKLFMQSLRPEKWHFDTCHPGATRFFLRYQPHDVGLTPFDSCVAQQHQEPKQTYHRRQLLAARQVGWSHQTKEDTNGHWEVKVIFVAMISCTKCFVKWLTSSQNLTFYLWFMPWFQVYFKCLGMGKSA